MLLCQVVLKLNFIEKKRILRYNRFNAIDGGNYA